MYLLITYFLFLILKVSFFGYIIYNDFENTFEYPQNISVMYASIKKISHF